MTNPNFNSMNEKDFDLLLENNMPDILPDTVVKEVNPLHNANLNILFSIAIGLINLGYPLVEYFLGTMSLISMLLGFRALHKENKWFRNGYIIGIIRFVYFISIVFFNATIYSSHEAVLLYQSISAIVMSIAVFIQYYCFVKGLRATQEKAGFEIDFKTGRTFLICYGIHFALALIGYSGFLVPIILIIIYIKVLGTFFNLSDALAKASFVIKTASSRFSDKWLIGGSIACVILALSVGFYFFRSYSSVQWTPQVVSTKENVEEIKNNLITLGFPEEVLKDLKEEDTLACKNALRIIVQEEDIRSDSENFDVTHVAIKLSDDPTTWKIIYHFKWNNNADFVGTEAITISATDFQNQVYPEYSGQILYDSGNQTYYSPYIILGDNDTFTTIQAAFSFPRKGEKHRGYISYKMYAEDAVNSWSLYYHQKSLLQYPVKTAYDYAQTNSTINNMAFESKIGIFQFWDSE